MSVLTLELPEELLKSVEELAAQRGEAVNDFCLRHLRAEVEAERPKIDGANHPLMKLAGITQSTVPDLESDPFWQAAGCLDSGTPNLETHPLMKLAGITESTVPDLADNHDFYLAEEIMNTHADEK